MKRPGRLESLFSAACFAITMAVTPLLHQFHCSGVCSAPKFSTAGEHACHGHAFKGGEASHSGSASNGCQCIDDCCSLTAHFTAPTVVVDLAPPTQLTFAAPAQWPGDAPRAPGVWLLPFATGPPPIA